MFKNYLKIAFRNLFKNKLYSAINIFGLSIGITFCILILLYLTDEFSYNSFHENSDRTYRAWVYEDYGDGDIYFDTVTPLGLKNNIDSSIPEAEYVTRFDVYETKVSAGERQYDFSETVNMVDPEFFNIFDFALLEGDRESVFDQISNIVITPSTARKYFGSEDVLNRTMLVKIDTDFEPFTVAGIIEEAPSNSTVQFDMLIPYENARKIYRDRFWGSWGIIIPETYVMLHKDSDIDLIDQQLLAMTKTALGERWAESEYTVGLQPITDIHLNPEFPASGLSTPIDPTFLFILGGIAFIVLLIACVNFMTLSISSSTSRAKEIGVRKAIGAERSSLMYQFWGEAILFTVLALIIGLILTEVTLPYFNSLSGSSLIFDLTLNTAFIGIGLTLFISLMAGIYPALILSGFRPIEVLKGKIQMKNNNNIFRTGMVVFQFTISIFLIACTFIILEQIDYLRSADLGFQKEHIVIVNTSDNRDMETGFAGLMERAEKTLELMNSELSREPDIKGLSVSLFTPADESWMYADFKDIDSKTRIFNINLVDESYPELMGFEFINGRSFSDEITSDRRQAVIVNQALVDDYGWTDPLNETLPNNNFGNHEIIGVVRNFNYSSLHNLVEPMALVVTLAILSSGIDNIGIPSSEPKLSIKINSSNIPETIATIEQAWNKIKPGEEFIYSFMEEAINSQYQQEERLSEIVTLGASFAIIIACLGLFGLASLVVVRRTKEIGVRKVLGASSKRIVILINREFTLLILLAILLSVPLIWFTMDHWLNNFAYRVDIGLWNIVLAGSLTLLIAWLTVGYQSFRATIINPVESLKSE